MSFVLETLTSPNIEILNTIIDKFEISDNKDSSCYDEKTSQNIEKDLLKNISQRAIEEKSKLHILYDERDQNNKIPCGIIALNFETIGSFFALSIDYLFISKQYRGIHFKEINSKISFHLLNFAVQEAMDMNNTSKLDAIILTPVNECVRDVYLDFGFIEFVDDWLYIPIENIT